MIGPLAGRTFGAPAASKPSRTVGEPSVGSMLGTGPSSVSLPCSTSCMAATVAIALVMEAMRKTVSGVIPAGWSSPRTPNAPSYSTPLSVVAIATMPGTSFASTACFRTPSMRALRPAWA